MHMAMVYLVRWHASGGEWKIHGRQTENLNHAEFFQTNVLLKWTEFGLL